MTSLSALSDFGSGWLVPLFILYFSRRFARAVPAGPVPRSAILKRTPAHPLQFGSWRYSASG